MSGIRKSLSLWVGIVGVVIGVVAGINSGLPAEALASNPKTPISGDNIFYAYVVSGEKVNVGFVKLDQPEPTGIAQQPVTVAVDAPGAASQSCVIPANVAVGGSCGFSGLTAPKTGIWKIAFTLPANAHIHPEVASSVHWGGNHFNWNINISDSTGEKKGRVWSELYAIRQPAPAANKADFTLYYESEDGYLYRATYRGYNGQLSTLSADAFGVVKKDTCVAAYQSILSANQTTMTPSFGTCGGSYKLFFEQPSDDLPQTAARWDSKQEWVRPAVDRPVVEGLKFTPDNNPDVQSGTITYNLKNFIGQYDVKIDTNADGNYDSADDIILHRQVKDLKSAGVQTIKFSGNDHSTNPIPRTQHMKIKISIAKAAEIHLVSGDVEGREGGIELVRLSGDNVPSSNVCWNDTFLDPIPGGVDTKLELDGTTCPESTGGVHAWKYSEDESVTWGNARYIDDWAYTSAKVDGTSEIEYPNQQAITEAAAKRNMNLGIIIAVSIIFVGLVGGLIYWLKRHSKHDSGNPTQPTF